MGADERTQTQIEDGGAGVTTATHAALVVDLADLDGADLARVGGKGANLGALARLGGVDVPRGFCVTTEAFGRFLATVPRADQLLDRLAGLGAGDRDAARATGEELRRAIERTPVPRDVAAATLAALERLGGDAVAVRSSATAEDTPAASFAGQHDSFLGVTGEAAVLEHVRLVWASLFSERAVAYRQRGGVDHRAVRMAVVVQRMASPQASGVLFTADPVNGDRTVSAVEAGFGLGEALVSGRVTADTYAVRAGEIIDRTIGSKAIAVHAAAGGGTIEQPVDVRAQALAALTDAQVVELERLGRSIEAHLGTPQDIEWCLDSGRLLIVQSRPITTLFPVPVAADDGRRVYVSTGHQQMMTDAMTPLGIAVFQMTAMIGMVEAGGRLFVDVTPMLATRQSRERLLGAFATGDPLIGDALRTIADREGFLPPVVDGPAAAVGPPATGDAEPIPADRAIVADLIRRGEASTAELERAVAGRTGSGLLDFIADDIAELKRIAFDPQGLEVIVAAQEATEWLNDRLERWLGERNAADLLTRSVPDNVTSEMGLALLDVADVIRPLPEVVATLEAAPTGGPGTADDLLDRLDGVAGGRQARAAIEAFLGRYGVRCVGEIDLGRPRWSEQPQTLAPVLLTNVRSFGPGEGRRRFAQGAADAAARERALLDRLRALPDGAAKAEETERMVRRLRTFSGYREYPKFTIVSRFAVYRRALLAEAERLVAVSVLRRPDDLFLLTFEELREAVRAGAVDADLLDRRAADLERHRALTPPRVLTSDGEAVAGSYGRDDVPRGALVGLAVSAGTVEGRARVVEDLEDATLEPGDILVTAFTDPSWTAAFVGAAGLVTEVGGLMTHGAVIAREYGLPAVVGVERATSLIRDGQRIRVHGTEGYVELVADAAS